MYVVGKQWVNTTPTTALIMCLAVCLLFGSWFLCGVMAKYATK